MNLFEIATKDKYRFPYRGLISVEDLWDLSAAHLDEIYKTLNAQRKKNNEESLLTEKSKEDEILSNKLELVKYIFEQKQQEKAARQQEKVNAEKRQKILDILASRQDAALEGLSDEALKKMLEELS